MAARWTTSTYVLILTLGRGNLPLLLGGKITGAKKSGKKKGPGRAGPTGGK